MATATLQKPGATLVKGERVRAAVELPRVPKGSEGTVTMVSGVSWVRYWVHFDNGQWIGTVGRDKLETDADVEAALALKNAPAAAQSKAGAVTAPGAAAAAAAGAAPDPGTEGNGAGAPGSVGGVPAHLLERSKLGRARWAEKHGGV